MVICPRKRFIRFPSKPSADHFQTSYERAHYFQIPITGPLAYTGYKKKPRKDLEVQNPPYDNFVSEYNKTYDTKYVGYVAERYGRFSATSRSTLKDLHEKYVTSPVMPLKVGLTTSGSTYVPAKEAFVPLSLSRASPVDDATCPVSAFGRDEFPTIPANETGVHKHLDTFVSTSQLTHVRFTREHQTGYAKKDIVTYYDTIDEPKCLGFGPQNVPSIGPYFPRCEIRAPSAYPKKTRAVPHKAIASTYKTDYVHASNSTPPRTPIPFPAVFKLSRKEVFATPGMYCTEQSHVVAG